MAPEANKVGMKNIQSLLPALIVALAVLGGLLGGAKIISDGVIQANRFQFVEAHEKSPKFFDTATGAVYVIGSWGWEHYLDDNHSLGVEIRDAYEWVSGLENAKQLIKDAR